MRFALLISVALLALSPPGAAEDEPEAHAGGRWGGRFRHTNLRAEGGGGDTEEAVAAGLDWLARHQCADGGWSAGKFAARCEGEKCGGPGKRDHDVASTALATLAFLGAGHTESRGKHAKTVKATLTWFGSIQSQSGRFGSGSDRMFLHDHVLATMTVIEAYALTGDPVRKKCAARALSWLLRVRAKDGGWGRGPRAKYSAPAITMWGFRVLIMARDAGGLEIEPSVFDRLDKLLDWWDDEEFAGKEPFFPRTERGLRAGFVLCREGRKHQRRYVLKHDPAVKVIAKGAPASAGEWHLATEAMFQVGGEPWKAWNQRMKKTLLPLQEKKGCARGSYDPAAIGEKRLGRVGVTACLTMSLQVYYRYSRCF